MKFYSFNIVAIIFCFCACKDSPSQNNTEPPMKKPDTPSYTYRKPQTSTIRTTSTETLTKPNYGYRGKAVEGLFFGVPYNSNEIRGKKIELLGKKYYVSLLAESDDFYGIYKYTLISEDDFRSLELINDEINSLKIIIESKYGQGRSVHEYQIEDNALEEAELQVSLGRHVSVPKTTTIMVAKYTSDENEIKIGYIDAHRSWTEKRYDGGLEDVKFYQYFKIIVELKSLYLIKLINNNEIEKRDSRIRNDYDKF